MLKTTEYMSLDSMTGIKATSFFLTGKPDAWARAVGKKREERKEKRGERKERKGEKKEREGKGEERNGREGEREKEREKDQGWEEEKQTPQASSFSF